VAIWQTEYEEGQVRGPAKSYGLVGYFLEVRDIVARAARQELKKRLV
jgi:hypothetical protein